ncbi:MoaD/ThiS family protein [bacterium SCSIO 12643]|nr:MoaD/ThiS family protein [bacterium SCSIO 12643]
MKIKILYFGAIAEIMQKTAEELEVGKKTYLYELKDKLESFNKKLKEMNFALAVNQKMTQQNIELQNGDEIAFFPPFAGG